tara:strand:+ start:17730 stop:18143 length:414 start_codon:yes stop_codon:yes gene_type:complete
MTKLVKSKLDNKKILHIYFNKSSFENRQDLCDPKEYLQVAALKLNKKKFQAHAHHWRENNNEKLIAQESWIVIKGKVKIYYYDTDGVLLETTVLNQGDCTITLEGGHNYEVLEDDTLVYEVKSGPYEGQTKDKFFIK